MYSQANIHVQHDVVLETARLMTEEEEEEEEWEYEDESDVYVRSKFFESWLWMDVDLPSTVDKDG